jgi:hypothetical protein
MGVYGTMPTVTREVVSVLYCVFFRLHLKQMQSLYWYWHSSKILLKKFKKDRKIIDFQKHAQILTIKLERLIEY